MCAHKSYHEWDEANTTKGWPSGFAAWVVTDVEKRNIALTSTIKREHKGNEH